MRILNTIRLLNNYTPASNPPPPLHKAGRMTAGLPALLVALILSGCDALIHSPVDYLLDHTAVVTVAGTEGREASLAKASNLVEIAPDKSVVIALKLNNSRNIPITLSLGEPVVIASGDGTTIACEVTQNGPKEALVTITGAVFDDELRLTLHIGADGRDFDPYTFTVRCPEYTVTFDNQEFGTSVDAQNVPLFGFVTKPNDLVSEGGPDFLGWSKDSAGVTLWNFSDETDPTPVTEDTVIYAKWDVTLYTVTFNNWGHGGTSPTPVYVYSGGLVTEPTTAPAETGYTFDGWYKEPTCINAWDFAGDTVTGDIILYAKWTPDITYTVTADGTAFATTTTKIDFVFSAAVSLAVDDITIGGTPGAATPGSLSGSGTNWSLTLTVSTAGAATVAISKAGIESGVKNITTHKALDNPSDPSIAAKFGIDVTAANSPAKVTEVFTALHDYLAAGPMETGTGTALKLGDIALGDYIDLDSLTVAGYPTNDATDGYGKITATNTIITPSSMPYGYDGRLLRLIVVGINAYNNINGNGNTPHLVFQFQNVPGFHRMNLEETNQGGYAASEMRTYLTGNFLTGLTAAGVPESVLWAPKHMVWNGFLPNDAADATTTTNTVVDTIEDKLFLPTEWEMFGSQNPPGPYAHTEETSSDQGRFAYYASDSARIKYSSTNANTAYWEASPSSTKKTYFCYVADNGEPDSRGVANTRGGFAPAFCVK